MYVEEDCLNGYYGDWIKECSIFLTADMEIFHTSILIQYHHIKNKIKTAEETLDKLNILVQNHTTRVHPIILGRIAAWNFIIYNDSSYLKRYVVVNSDILENITTITFFYRLVYIYGNQLQFVQFDYITLLRTDNLDYTKIPFDIKTELMMYYLMLTRYYVENKENILALQIMEKIDKRYQFSCSSAFFEKEYSLLANTLKL